GLAAAGRAAEPARGHRAHAVRRRALDPGLSSGRGAFHRRARAGTRLRAELGRRHDLHEMGEDPGRPAHRYRLADRARRGWLRAVVVGLGLPCFQGVQVPAPVSLRAVLAVLYNGLIGTGFAYILWFAIIARLPTATASLGSLATPVIGVGGSMLILGERLTIEDIVGFALIFAAAVCVLVQPRRSAAAQAP